MYQALIVEDDERDAEVLVGHLRRYAQEHRLEVEAVVRRRAGDMVFGRRCFDVVFLDIELPGMDGMEAAHLLRSYDTATPIVFVTNLSRYAVRGYEVGALDFLVKPVSYRDFSLHMARVERTMRAREGRSVIIRSKGDVRIVPMPDVLRVTVRGHRVSWALAADEIVETRGSLAEAEEGLSEGPFVRLSKGCLVNMSHIRTVHGDVVEMDDGTAVRLARSRRRETLVLIAQYLGRAV